MGCRGCRPAEAGLPFWSLVVISAGDAAQADWYEAQLKVKRECGELPLVSFLCLADPPGPRLGSGGSTLAILAALSSSYSQAELDSMRVLVIHAGGFSKRLPSHSCSGKIFSPLPVQTAGRPYQMLDLKLALYLPFLNLMQPGLFITASDDIEVFNLAEAECAVAGGKQITALAHPSSLYIGTTHGVYVLGTKAGEEDGLVTVAPCLEVLQKPSVELMRARGAVVAGRQGERVYSDSAFWFPWSTAAQLELVWTAAGGAAGLGAEICIYGDLLTCLGEREDRDAAARLAAADPALPSTRAKQALAAAVRGTGLQVLALHQSRFYHLGTTQEYLHGLTQDKRLRLELNLSNSVCSRIAPGGEVHGIVLNSVLNHPAVVPSDSVVEYSILDAKVRQSFMTRSLKILNPPRRR